MTAFRVRFDDVVTPQLPDPLAHLDEVLRAGWRLHPPGVREELSDLHHLTNPRSPIVTSP